MHQTSLAASSCLLLVQWQVAFDAWTGAVGARLMGVSGGLVKAINQGR